MPESVPRTVIAIIFCRILSHSVAFSQVCGASFWFCSGKSPTMAQRNWEVDTVRAQAKFLSITGAMKTVYYVLWRGFAAAEATWEPRSSFDREADMVWTVWRGVTQYCGRCPSSRRTLRGEGRG